MQGPIIYIIAPQQTKEEVVQAPAFVGKGHCLGQPVHTNQIWPRHGNGIKAFSVLIGPGIAHLAPNWFNGCVVWKPPSPFRVTLRQNKKTQQVD